MTKAVDPRAYRRTIGLFATGVTVVAVEVEGEVQAMTANALTSVSLDPLWMLVCVGRQATMAGFMERCTTFSINILREDQQALSTYFAGGWKEDTPPPFRMVPWDGTPRLEGSLAAIRCRREKLLDGGDHWIVIGEVIDLHLGVEPHHPLLFYGGRYHQIARGDEAPAPGLENVAETQQVFYDPWEDEE